MRRPKNLASKLHLTILPPTIYNTSKMSAPASHKQPSRKGPKAWRKNIDLTQVQSGLENTRDELLAGGIIAERDSADLFTTDVAGDAEVARKQASRKLLKADEIISQRSAIPAIPKRKRKDEVTVFEGSGPSGKKRKNGEYISYKDMRRLKMIADGGALGMQFAEGKADHDPWGEAAPVQGEKFSFLEPRKAKVAPKSLALAPNAITKNGKAVANVRKPEAGKSYNPNVTDWTALYEREGAAAVEKEKERLRLEAEVEAREAAALEEAARVEEAEKEAFATDYESAWESEWDGIQSGGEEKVVHTKKMQKRKTPAERNKIKARKEREQKEKWEKKQKIRIEQEKHIKKIARELSEKDRAKRAGTLVANEDGHSDSSSDDGTEAAIVKRRFGKVAMPEAPLEVTLPEDLEDTLRRLKPEGNLLTDRYRNLLLNGKLEIRKPVGQRKQKQTYRTEKWSYKDWELK